MLLFIALTLGPSAPQKIAVTSNSENYVWTHTTAGWNFYAQGFPASDFTREPSKSSVMTPETAKDFKAPIKTIVKHDWSHDSVMVLDNGDRVEKRHNTGFYIINAGGANEKVYTIRYDEHVISK
jgi:hypothetical protein